MYRWLVIVTIAAGCGNVHDVPDGPPPPPDGPGIDLERGCVLKLLMEEMSWPTSGSPVINGCGSAGGSLTGTGAMPITAPGRPRVGSFSGTACVDFASTPALHGTTGLTMSAFVKPTALDGQTSNGIITKRNDRSMQSEFALFVWTGNHVWIDLGDMDRYSGTASLTNGFWSLLVAVFDGTRSTSDPGRVRLFIDGVNDPLQHVVIGNLDKPLALYDSPVHIGCTPAPSATPP